MSSPFLTADQMRAAEENAFAQGISAAELMREVGEGMAEALHSLVPGPARAILYLGKGHNAGDALVAGRHLMKLGWTVDLRCFFPDAELAPLTRTHLETLLTLGARKRDAAEALQTSGNGQTTVALDGLLGIGSSGIPRGPVREGCEELLALRQAHIGIAALDVPSGLNADTGAAAPCAVRADWTLTVAWPKAGLMVDGAEDYAGRIVVIPTRIPLPDPQPICKPLIPSLLRPLLPSRPFSTHKGQAGRLLVIAGSAGSLGAAELACLGALRAGAGLVTLAVDPEWHAILAARVPAEVMVRRCPATAEDWAALAREIRADAVSIGPGLSPEWHTEIQNFLRNFRIPAVVDAEALRAIASVRDTILRRDPAFPLLLTPHPGEMNALFPEHADFSSRLEAAEAFRALYPAVTLLWKGARTLVTGPHSRWWNTTGHPGMATGGMGDVLTGMAGAFLAGGLSAESAAALAVWLAGRAAELAVPCQGQESLLPTDLAHALPRAFAALRDSDW